MTADDEPFGYAAKHAGVEGNRMPNVPQCFLVSVDKVVVVSGKTHVDKCSSETKESLFRFDCSSAFHHLHIFKKVKAFAGRRSPTRGHSGGKLYMKRILALHEARKIFAPHGSTFLHLGNQ